MRMWARAIVVSWAGALLLVLAGEGPTVTLPQGRLRGKYVVTRGGRTVQAFLGIPYAKPPVGDLRFEPPQPPDCWRPEERLAVVEPTPCPQIIELARGNEDCLYLNVYTPHVSSRPRLPVIVYIIGGAFELGAVYGYDPTYYLDEDVVLVPVQHRVGLLGFLSTGDEVVPGNMGLKDLRQALRWVQRNIRYFGGDSSRVTVGGVSSGAVAAHYLMLYTAHEGLVHGGISESGVALATWGFRPPPEVKFMVNKLAEISQCPNDSVGFVACLKTKTPLQLIVYYDVMYKEVVYESEEVLLKQILPLIGGVIEPACVEDPLITDNPWDRNTTLPWLTGVTSKELLFLFSAESADAAGAVLLAYNALFDYYFPTAMNYQNSVTNGTAIAAALRRFYLDDQPISRLTFAPFIDGISDGVFVYPMYEAVRRATREKTFVYFFDFLTANQIFLIPPYARIGAAHSDTLWMFFEEPGTPVPDRLVPTPPPETQLSRIMVNMWVNFATCLDPTPSKWCAVEWEPFLPNESYLYIGGDVQLRLYSERPFLPDRMKFWQDQPYPIRDDHYDEVFCRRSNASCSTV